VADLVANPTKPSPLPSPDPQAGSPPGEGENAVRVALAYIGVAVLTIAAFARSMQNDFIRYDDPDYLLNNPHVYTGLSWANVWWAFDGIHVENWHPLAWLSHMLDCQLFGLNPAWHHAISLALHVVSAILLLQFLRETTGKLGLSFVAAAIWAVHPLRIESVAWAAERKDVLSVLFGMACLAAYARYARRPSVAKYLLVGLLYGLSLLSKQTLVTLPFLLLLLDWWPLGRMPSIPLRKLIAEKVPLLAMALAASLVILLAQKSGGAVKAIPIGLRLESMLSGYVRYIGKTLRPTGLALFYPSNAIAIWEVVASAMVIGIITLAVILMRRLHPYLFVGWFWFLGTLVPVSGIVQLGVQSIANRYTYWPTIGLTIAIVWEAAAVLDRSRLRERTKSVIGVLGSAVVISSLGASTFVQLGYWRDTISVFSHDLEVTENNFVAHGFLGNELAKQGDDEEAAAHDLESLRIYPQSAAVRDQLARLLLKHNNPAGAIEQYRAAEAIEPGRFETQQGLGIAFSAMGDAREAAECFKKGVEIEPGNAQARINFGYMLKSLGRDEEARQQFEAALQIDPNNKAASRAMEERSLPTTRRANGD
jgi:protein O-mannosyl-transferase